MKIVIIGGVAGGATAATRIRRLNEKTEIIIFERSNYISYANCGLPYYIGDEIKDKKTLTLQTPLSLWNRYRIDVRVSHEVLDINSNQKKVRVKNLINGDEFEESYDKLLISPGAKPVILPFLKDVKNVFTLRTVEDTFKIKEYISNNQPKSAVIVGGGFIGVEMAENLVNLGIDVTIIQKDNHLLGNIDRDIASFIHHHIRSKGVKILLNTDIKDVMLNYDMILVSIGVAPDNSLAIKAGLELGYKGSIKVNGKMETSIKDIYAVGDAVEITHYVLNEKRIISLAAPANKQARVAADNICGIENEYKGSLASSIIKVFDMTVATTGIKEKEAIEANLNYEKVILSPASHATYYPGATTMTLKVIYEKETLKILGAQAVGYDGVDKRIDIIATAIFAGMKATELKDLDLAYAPPYSSAKDPVNVAGFIIDNIESEIVEQFYYEDIEELRKKDDAILLDTRTKNEYNLGFAEGFINIPLDELRDKISLLDKNKKIYVMCQSGLRSYLATRILKQNGFKVYNFAGGYKLYGSVFNDR